MANVKITGFVNEGGVTKNKTPNKTTDSLISECSVLPATNNGMDLGSDTLRWSAMHIGNAFFNDVLLIQLSIPSVQLQTDTNAYTFTCPYDLEITGIQLILDNHGTSGNVTVTTSVVGGATLDSTSITSTNTFATTTFSSDRDQGDDIRFAITATPTTNTNGLRANLLFRRR